MIGLLLQLKNFDKKLDFLLFKCDRDYGEFPCLFDVLNARVSLDMVSVMSNYVDTCFERAYRLASVNNETDF